MAGRGSNIFGVVLHHILLFYSLRKGLNVPYFIRVTPCGIGAEPSICPGIADMFPGPKVATTPFHNLPILIPLFAPDRALIDFSIESFSGLGPQFSVGAVNGQVPTSNLKCVFNTSELEVQPERQLNMEGKHLSNPLSLWAKWAVYCQVSLFPMLAFVLFGTGILFSFTHFHVDRHQFPNPDWYPQTSGIFVL
ncbi:hypothetical protein K438DRAFT_1756040 [Mycena galopus ATCC 62051]|nr:hypothetical protein K438DRAFT_1756040 [Mycena galopus ATCC 62051]